jgi:pimeloyl-ACP methyl ester carboxylesterase
MRKGFVIPLLAVSVLMISSFCGCGGGKGEVQKGRQRYSLEAAELRKVEVGDIEMAYKTLGAGEPLVLIMGFSGTMDLWEPLVVEELASAGYQVIVFDNRGMGETSAGTEDFTMAQFARDTAGLIQALGIERAHFLAWSMGTNIAQELALTYPESTDRLILYAADCGGPQAIQPSPDVMSELTDTSGTPEERGMRLFNLLFPQEWLNGNPDFYILFPSPEESSPPENVARQAEAMYDWGGSYDRLPDITAPTLLVTGTEDILTPPQNSLIITGRIPGAWLVQFKGAGHGLMYQYPDRFAAVVLDFLANSP